MSYTLPIITSEEISLFSKYFHELTGISLGTEKGYLIENRFSSIMASHQCSSFAELYYMSRGNRHQTLEQKLIDAITTHETSFFRDRAPFDLLQQKIIPNFIRDRGRERPTNTVPLPLSIWSAACSTGQEIYSIAMILKESLKDFQNYSIKLLGSDISEESIQKAIKGQYNDYEINRGLGKERIQRFFEKKEECWGINAEIRAISKFQKINLIKPFCDVGKFDLIFCRNVAVYFSQKDRNKFFRNIAQAMTPESYLFIGATESLNELRDLFVSTRDMGATYYQLK